MKYKKLFCFGFGYVCSHLEKSLRNSDSSYTWEIGGTTTNPEKQILMEERNVSLVVQDQDQDQGLSDISSLLQGVTHLLISIPPQNLGCPVFRSYLRDIVNIETLEWIGYLSTTGVYGDRHGDWVDETSEIQPSTIRGTRRAKAEEQWLSLFRRYNAPVHIFRLAGIYGVGRSAIDSVQVGIARRIYKENHVFNRIHIDDITQILETSMLRPKAGAIYNVSDDEPVPSHMIIAEAARLLGVQEPPLIDIELADLPPITQSFYSDNKRVRNTLIKEELGIKLKYPTYRDGLKQCYESVFL